MDLSAYLKQIAATYDRRDSLSSSAQLALRSASDLLSVHVAGGIHITGSGGKGTPTLTPWIGFLDPDETTSPREGVYVVYLYSEDLQHVTLSLNQGIEFARESLGDLGARERIRQDAEAIRGALPAEILVGLDVNLDLGSLGQRQRAYEAGNICAIRYAIESLPVEEKLQADLDRVMHLYQRAVEAKRQLLQSRPGSITSASILLQSKTEDPLADFKPKDDSDYVVALEGRVLVKTRRHETLVRQYGEWAGHESFRVSSAEHPRDLVLRQDAREWLVEAKVVYGGRAALAVRASIGQLFEYRRFLCPGRTPVLVALFSEPVGGAYVSFLESLGIESVWKAGEGWEGSSGAVADGLATVGGER